MLTALYILIGIAIVVVILLGTVAALLKWSRTREWTLERITAIKEQWARTRQWVLPKLGWLTQKAWEKGIVPALKFSWKPALLFTVIGAVLIGLWFIKPAEDTVFVFSGRTWSWIGANVTIIVGVVLIVLCIFLRVSSKKRLEEKELTESQHKIAQKIASLLLSVGLLLPLIGAGWTVSIISGESILEFFRKKWSAVTSEFEIPWLTVLAIAVIGGIVVVGLLSWFLNRLFPLLFYHYRRRILLGSLALVTALNAILYWFYPQAWMEVATQPLFWVIQVVGILLAPVVVNKAKKRKLLTATTIVLLFLGLGWLGATYGPGEFAPEISRVRWSLPRVENTSASTSEVRPEPIATGRVSWVMPEGVKGEYGTRSSSNRVEVIRNDEDVFHYITFCRFTDREHTVCIWNRKTSERGWWRTVDLLKGGEVREGDWYLHQDPDNPLVYRGAWSSPVSSGGKDVPYTLVLDP